MNPTVLVVDDAISMRALLAACIEERIEGAKCLVAHNGQEAVRLMIECKAAVDLIVLDRNMPRISGVALIRFLRENGFQMPIIMVTALQNRFEIQEALSVGANDYIAKPFKTDDLVKCVEKWLCREALSAPV